jgi:hypothetical protein
MIRCPLCPKREELRKKFKKDLLQLLVNTNTNTTVIRVLTSTINAWLNSAPIPNIQEIAPDASNTLNQAHNFQKAIGWEQIFKGRLSFAWGEMYNFEQQLLKQQNSNHRMITAESWGTNVRK